jgi:hypothetical protein
MTGFWLHVTDWFFVVFHLLFTLFNISGWAWRKTRRLNLITLLLTGLSWTVLGLFYGFGYCPLTDWHWQVLHELDIYNLPSSYLEYLAERMTGLDFKTDLINTLTVVLFSAALLASIGLNLRDYFRKKSVDA